MAKAGKRSNGETYYNSTRAKRSKPSNSNRQPAQMGDVPDPEEELGHSTSVQFLAAAKEPAKRSHTAVSDLKNIVEEETKRLAKLLEQKAFGVTKRDSELKDTLIKVIHDAQRDRTEIDEEGVDPSSTSKPTACAIYQSAKSNIASSRGLLGHYERASQQVASGQRVPMMESGWEKDILTLQRILNQQGEKIKSEVHQILNEDSESSKEQFKCNMSDLDTDLWNRFAVGEAKEKIVEALDGRREDTWAVVAKNAQRGVRRTVKNLPEDGE